MTGRPARLARVDPPAREFLKLVTVLSVIVTDSGCNTSAVKMNAVREIIARHGTPTFIARSAKVSSDQLENALVLEAAQEIDSKFDNKQLLTERIIGTALIYVRHDVDRFKLPMMIPDDLKYGSSIDPEKAKLLYGMVPAAKVDWKQGDLVIANIHSDGNVKISIPKRIEWVLFNATNE